MDDLYPPILNDEHSRSSTLNAEGLPVHRAFPVVGVRGSGALSVGARGSIDDEKLCATLGVGAVGLCVVRDLVAHAWLQRELSSVVEFGMKFTFRTKKDMALNTPMIGKVPRRILNHANSNSTEELRSPICASAFALVLGGRKLRPVGRSEWDVVHLHE